MRVQTRFDHRGMWLYLVAIPLALATLLIVAWAVLPPA